jgi:catechol 2,3-dioxygenase-like lactoylglutathione lyase family enzyme
MRLNHLDLHVPDVDAAVAFFTRYFDLTLIDVRGNGALAILSDGQGLELVLSQPAEKLGATDQLGRPVSYHVGFIVDDRTSVDRINAAMIADGLDVRPPREMRGGWLFYCSAPGNVLVEVGARPLLA